MKNGDCYVWHFFSFANDQITIKSDQLPDNATLSRYILIGCKINYTFTIVSSLIDASTVNEKRDEATETRNKSLLTGF